MRVTGDLGFSSLVLVVVCFVVPVIGFVIHRKWQFALARQEEIKRLLILAAEEAARAESEASYTYGTFSAPKVNQCAVCYSPTTTRCARCKAVRYCSGKCQIIHWRQGHKEECHPPSTTCQDDDVFDDHKEAEKDRRRILEEKSEVEGTRCKTVSKKPPLSGNSSPEVSSGKDDINNVEPLAAGSITDSNSESSSNSFSGFSSSTVASESSDDASVCESVISNEPERSEGHIFADPALDMHDGNSSDNGMDGMGTVPSSPKFANLVDAVDDFSIMRNLNQTRPSFIKEKGRLAKNGSSCLSMGKEVTVEPHTVSSGFWDKTLDSVGTEDGAKNDLLPSCSNEPSDHQKSGSDSSIHVSVNTLPPMHVKGQEEEDSASDGCVLNSVGNMASVGSALSENDCMGSLKRQNSTSSGCKGSKSTSLGTMSEDYHGPSLSFAHHSLGVGKNSGCADASSISNLQSAGSKASNNILVDPDITSHQVESVEVRRMPSLYAGSHLESRTKSYAHSRTTCGSSGVQSGIGTSSQVASRSPPPKNGLKTSMLKVVDQFKGSNSSKRLSLAVGSDVSGRYSDKGLFSYDSFVKLYNWNKADLQPFGLVNCGNSCYANAVLQCLAFTPPLTAYLLQGLHSKACAKKGCFTCEFESLVLKSKGTKSALSPKGILSQLQNIGSRLCNGREEDAHEFLRSAIDTMQLVCLTEAGLNASGSSEEETTLMGLTFGGYLRSKIKCMKCGGKSERQERMMDLTVAIEGEIATLEEALRQFTSTEALEGENKYHCVRCKSYENARKKMTVSEAPNILTIALKRFQSGKFGKLNKPIRFPEILDLAPFMSGTSDKSPIYRLYGVVVHLDVMNAAFSGHYVCYVKNSQNKWFKVDDSVVTPVELERVLTKGAYMLLYARCSPRAPRLIRNSDSKSKAVNGKMTIMKSRWAPMNSVATEYFPSSVSPNGPPTLDPFNSKFHHMKRILEDDSSSDNSSLISTNSDEGSCSTDSTRYSTSTDDFSEYIFGESGCGWNNTWKNSDTDTSSSSASSSPLNFRHSPLSDKHRYDSGFPNVSGLRTPAGLHVEVDSPLYRDYAGVSRVVDTERGVSLLRSDSNIHVRKLDNSSSCSSSSSSSINWETNYFGGVGSSNHCSKSCRKSRERTD